MRVKFGASGAAAVLLLTGALGLGTPSPASADGCGKQQCLVLYNQAIYYPRQVVKYDSDRGFKPHEAVRGTLTCEKNYVRHFRHLTARSGGRVKGAFRLSRHTPVGECTFTLKARHSSNGASGNFYVKHHHTG